MRIGIFISDTNGERTTLQQVIAHARWAEDSGFHTGWVPHLPWSLDSLTALALTGPSTARIELGTAVVPTYPVHPLAMARQAATVQVATGGRFTLGIGPSHPVVIEQMHGLSYDQPARHVRDYLGVLRAAFAGSGHASHSGAVYSVNSIFEVPNMATPPSILIAALAPLMLRVAGELTDGTITYWADERAVGEHVVPRISAAAADAGRAPPRVVVGVPVAVCPAGEVEEVKERAARLLSVYEAIPTYQRILGRGSARGPVDVCAIGDEAAVAGRFRSYADAGASDVMAAPLTVDRGPEGLRRTLDALADLARG